jgi:anti-anti-sigma factor
VVSTADTLSPRRFGPSRRAARGSSADTSHWGAALDFSIERSVEPDGTVRLVLHGEADIAARGRLRAALRRESSAHTAVVVVLDQLDYLDSAGVSELMEACQRTRLAGRRFAVTPGTGHVRHVLWISGVLAHLCGPGPDHSPLPAPGLRSRDTRA